MLFVKSQLSVLVSSSSRALFHRAPVAAAVGVMMGALAPSSFAQSAAEPVVITASRLEQNPREVVGDVAIITAKDIEITRARSIEDVLRTVPGIQFASNGGMGKSTSFFIRGANSNQTLLLIDGMRIGSAEFGGSPFQNIPIEQVERIEVLKGPASSLYGADAIGGVVQIFTKKGATAPGGTVRLGIGTQGSGLLGAGFGATVGDTSYRVGLSANTTDGTSAISNPANGSYNPDKDGYRNGSLSASVSHRFNDRHQVGFNFLGAKSRNEYDSSPTGEDFNRDKLQSYGVQSKHRLAEIWTASLQLSRSTDDQRFYSPGSFFKQLTNQTQFVLQNDIKVGPGMAVVALEHLKQDVNGSSTYTTRDRTVNSALLGYTASIGAASLQANLRADKNSQYGEQTNGFVGGNYNLTSRWQVGAAAGTGFQAPLFGQLYGPFGANPDLQPEKSKSVDAFVRYSEGNYTAKATVFRNQIRNLINYVTRFENIQRANIKGLSLEADRRWGDFSAGGHVDFMLPIDETTAPGNQLLLRRSRRAGTLFAQYAADKMNGRVELVTQSLRRDLNFATFPAQNATLAGYGSLNVSGGYQVSKELTAGVRIENALARKYELARDYNVPKSTIMFTLNYSCL